MAFQPVLYFFIFGASIRLLIQDGQPPYFHMFIGYSFYGVWLGLCLGGPMLALVAFVFIRKFKRKFAYVGLWLRLSADIAVFTSVLTYHIASLYSAPYTESVIFGRYIIGATLVFLLLLLVRDCWILTLTEKLAKTLGPRQ